MAKIKIRNESNTGWYEIGSSGAQGPQGVQGNQGFQGASGVQGLQGPSGSQGATGAQGYQGIVGAQGTQGVKGNQGPMGAQGTPGAQGFQGVAGNQGVQGAAGVQGSMGPQGAQGPQGLQGVVGPQGFQGSTGSQGTQGPQGNVGSQGSQGQAGAVGATGIQYKGAWVSTTAYVLNDVVYVGGTTYICMLANTNFTPPNTKYWNVLALQGTQGSAGPQGSTGSQGSQGAAGAQGLRGAQGSQGNTGSQGLTGPQGNQGLSGPQGAKGAQGPQGNAGSQGPIGYQGNQGKDGVQGSPGLQGSQGKVGSQGSTGPQGAQGSQGKQGSQGQPGPQGSQGLMGTQGSQGRQGAQGAQGLLGTTLASAVELLAGGYLRQGKQTADSTTTGFYLGNDNGIAKFHIGNATNSLYWTGTALNLNGTAVSTIISNASSGKSAYDAVNSTTSGLATKLNKASSEILNIDTSSTVRMAGLRVGDIAWNSNGTRTSGKGLALTPKGIIGHNGTTTTFTVGIDGNATFAGSLSAARISVGSSVNATKFFEDNGNGMSLLSAAYAVYSNPGTLTTTGGYGTVAILTTNDGTLKFKRNDANHAIERRIKNASVVFKVSCSAIVDDQLSVWWRFDGGTWYHLYGLAEPQAKDGPVSFTYTGVLGTHQSSTAISTIEFGFAPCNVERYTSSYDKLYIKNLTLSVEFLNF